MNAVKWLDEHFEEIFLVIFLILISCITLLQIICRTFFSALTWPEEFCRYVWVWTVFLSIPYTIRQANILRVNVLMDMIPGKARNAFNILIDVVNLLVLAVLSYYSFTVVINTKAAASTSPAMLWPLWIIYLCVPIGMVLGTLRAAQSIYFHVRDFDKRAMTTLEQAQADAAAEAAAAGAGTGEGGAE